jgi:hypothetical protein
MDIIVCHDPEGVDSNLIRKFCAKNMSQDPIMVAHLPDEKEPFDFDLNKIEPKDIFQISRIKSKLILALKGRDLPESLTDDWVNWKHGLLMSHTFIAILKEPKKITKKRLSNFLLKIKEVELLTVQYVEAMNPKKQRAKIKNFWKDSFLNVLKSLGELSSSIVLISPFPDGMGALSDDELFVGYNSEHSLTITSDSAFLQANGIEFDSIDFESLVHSFGTNSSWDFTLHNGETASFEFDD